MHICMAHLRKSCLSTLSCKSTSRTKTFTKVKIFGLNRVRVIPLMAAKTLAGVEISLVSLPRE